MVELFFNSQPRVKYVMSVLVKGGRISAACMRTYFTTMHSAHVSIILSVNKKTKLKHTSKKQTNDNKSTIRKQRSTLTVQESGYRLCEALSGDGEWLPIVAPTRAAAWPDLPPVAGEHIYMYYRCPKVKDTAALLVHLLYVEVFIRTSYAYIKHFVLQSTFMKSAMIYCSLVSLLVNIAHRK